MTNDFFDLRKVISNEKKITKELEAVYKSLKHAENKEEKEWLILTLPWILFLLLGGHD